MRPARHGSPVSKKAAKTKKAPAEPWPPKPRALRPGEVVLVSAVVALMAGLLLATAYAPTAQESNVAARPAAATAVQRAVIETNPEEQLSPLNMTAMAETYPEPCARLFAVLHLLAIPEINVAIADVLTNSTALLLGEGPNPRQECTLMQGELNQAVDRTRLSIFVRQYLKHRNHFQPFARRFTPDTAFLAFASAVLAAGGSMVNIHWTAELVKAHVLTQVPTDSSSELDPGMLGRTLKQRYEADFDAGLAHEASRFKELELDLTPF